jgi:hypothetical protein
MRSAVSLIFVVLIILMAPGAFANHEPTPTTEENGEAVLLLSSTSTTTTAVVGGIILTVMMASDADSMEQYLEENAVALQTDLSLGAGETVDDLALAFGVKERDRARFGKLVRANRKHLLELADPAHLSRARAERFIEVLLVASTEAGVADTSTFERG